MSSLRMNTKPVIAIDIDDVIAANATAFIEFSNKRYGTHLTVDDYHEHWAELWKVSRDEAEQRAVEYHDSGHIGTYSVIEGADQALRRLKKQFKLIALTSRRNCVNQLTRDWLVKYYPNIFEDIVFCGFFDSQKVGIHYTKGELAKCAGADYIIDDQLKHVSAAAQNGIKGLLFGNYFWNKADILPENVTRVKDWEEVLDYFKVDK